MLACLKNRHGEPVDVALRFDGSLQRFESANIWRPEDFDVSQGWQGGGEYE